MLTFNFNTDKEALHEIQNGHIDKDIFQHLIETEGFISWGNDRYILSFRTCTVF